MILIFGRYNRTVNLPPTPGHCPACRTHASIFWRRHYKTGHFFFFPLFSFSEQHQAALEAQLITGAAYGGSEEEKTLASKVFSSMQKDEGLPAKGCRRRRLHQAGRDEARDHPRRGRHAGGPPSEGRVATSSTTCADPSRTISTPRTS